MNHFTKYKISYVVRTYYSYLLQNEVAIVPADGCTFTDLLFWQADITFLTIMSSGVSSIGCTGARVSCRLHWD